MVWSHSRIETFADCPYRFFLKYISKCKPADRFFSSYGSFMHKLIEQYYTGNLSKDGMFTEYLVNFSDQVRGERPKGEVSAKYFKDGAAYLEIFQPFPYETVAVEKHVRFDVDGLPFVGYIDYVGRKDGKYSIVDHKSRNMKPRSKRKTPTVKDGELDSMLRQLYLYAEAWKQLSGEYPASLCFNCFRTGTFIEEPFREEALCEAKRWAKSNVEMIKQADDFYPMQDFFACRYICDVSEECIYFQSALSERRVR